VVGLCQWKIPVISRGIEPVWLVKRRQIIQPDVSKVWYRVAVCYKLCWIGCQLWRLPYTVAEVRDVLEWCMPQCIVVQRASRTYRCNCSRTKWISDQACVSLDCCHTLIRSILMCRGAKYILTSTHCMHVGRTCTPFVYTYSTNILLQCVGADTYPHNAVLVWVA